MKCIICKTEMTKNHEKICDDCINKWISDQLATVLPASGLENLEEKDGSDYVNKWINEELVPILAKIALKELEEKKE